MFQRIFNLISAFSLLLIIAFAIFFFTHKLSIVYADSVLLVNNYKSMQDARKAYQQKATTWKANTDTLVSEVQRQIMRYEKESGKMTSKERQLSQELIKTKQKQLAEY